ncbi:hypothetical protein [Blautia pseudococcoides]|nr:hypothetical protein [Blautia pseudococcoides]
MEHQNYRKPITKILNEKHTVEWLKAVYSFVKNYPDRGPEKKE